MTHVLCSEQPSLSESNLIVLDGLHPCGTVARREPRGDVPAFFADWQLLPSVRTQGQTASRLLMEPYPLPLPKAPVTADALTQDDIGLQDLPPGLDVPIGVRLTRPVPASRLAMLGGSFDSRALVASGEGFTGISWKSRYPRLGVERTGVLHAPRRGVHNRRAAIHDRPNITDYPTTLTGMRRI
jgi:hypothetical protein